MRFFCGEAEGYIETDSKFWDLESADQSDSRKQLTSTICNTRLAPQCMTTSINFCNFILQTCFSCIFELFAQYCLPTTSLYFPDLKLYPPLQPLLFCLQPKISKNITTRNKHVVVALPSGISGIASVCKCCSSNAACLGCRFFQARNNYSVVAAISTHINFPCLFSIPAIISISKVIPHPKPINVCGALHYSRELFGWRRRRCFTIWRNLSRICRIWVAAMGWLLVFLMLRFLDPYSLCHHRQDAYHARKLLHQVTHTHSPTTITKSLRPIGLQTPTSH